MAFITAETRSSIVELAMGMLNQAPSTAMLNTLIAKSVEGASIQDLADYIATTDAFTAEYPATQTAREFATEMFGKLITGGTLDADINTAVIDLLEGLLIAGTTKAQGFVAVIEFLANPANVSHPDLGDISQSFQNRADAAEYFSITKELGGSTDAELAAAIASVTSDADTLTAANAAADATADAEEVVAGQTFTLTTDAETIVGTAGNDRFVAVTIGEGGVGSTLLPGDVIDGGAGTDKLLLSTSGTYPNGDYTVAAIQASDIEIVHVNGFDVDTDNTIIDLTLMGTSIQEVGLASSNATGDVSFINPKNFVDATMNNGSGDLTITYGALALGSSDVQNLSLANVSAGTATFAGVETINVSTSLANSKLTDLVISGANTLNISGDKKLTVINDIDFKDFTSPTATGAEADGTVDASGSTGGVDLTFSSADNVVVTGSSGNDTIRMGGSKTYYDSIDGGDGDDTVTISLAAATGTKVANSYQLLGLSNVETLSSESTNDAAAIDAEGLSADITTLATNSSGATLTIANGDVNAVPNADAATLDIAAVTFTLNGVARTTDALNIPLADGATAEANVAAAVAAVIEAVTGFTASATGGVVTIASTSTSRTEVQMSELAGGAVTAAGVADTATNMTYTNLPDDGSIAVTVNSGADVTLGLIDGSGEDDVINLNFAPTASDKSVTKTIDLVSFAAAETLNINVSGMTDTVDTVVTALTADNALSTIKITGESDLTINAASSITAGRLTLVDASEASGDVKLAIPANAVAGTVVKGGSGKDSFDFEGTLGLNVYDVVSGGEGADSLSASIAGFAGAYEALNALNISDVETINFKNAGTSTVNAANITGAEEISVSDQVAGGVAPNTLTTLKNLAADVAIGLGQYRTNGDISGRIDFSLADASGEDDSIDIILNDTDEANTNTVELRTSGIETANIKFGYNGSADTALADHVLDVDKLNVKKLTVSGSTRDLTNTLNLQTLDTDTTTLDASAYAGILTVTAGTGIATEFSVKANAAHNITGSTKSETFNVVGTTQNTAITINGNGGAADTLNMSLGNGPQDFSNVSNIDTINFAVVGSADVTAIAATSLAGIDTAKSIVFTGGNSLSSVVLGLAGGAANTLLTGGAQTNVFDFSNYGGSATLNYVADGYNDAQLGYTHQVIGGAATTDRLNVTFAPSAVTRGINTQGVEKLGITLSNSATQQVVDFTKVTGMNEVFISDASSESIQLSALPSGVKVDVTSTEDAATGGTSVEIVMADATASNDAITVELNPVAAGDHVNLTVADVETVTVEADSAGASVSLAGVSMTGVGETVAIVVGGSNATTITAGNADIASINAAGSVGGVTQSARAATSAVTYTGGAGNDTFIMLNSGDVINAAGGTGDNLVVTKNAILGGINVDLNADNQVVSFNGGSISGTVTGFEDVDLSGYTGNFGAQVSGLNTVGSTIIGTGNADEINGGTGADTITGGAGADNLSGGAGADTFIFNQTASADTIADYSVASDSIHVDNSVYTGLGADGALAAAEFESGAGLVAAATAAGRMVYNTTTGDLYYDADGSNAAVAPVLIGTFTNAPTLVAGEFTII